MATFSGKIVLLVPDSCQEHIYHLSVLRCHWLGDTKGVTESINQNTFYNAICRK